MQRWETNGISCSEEGRSCQLHKRSGKEVSQKERGMRRGDALQACSFLVFMHGKGISRLSSILISGGVSWWRYQLQDPSWRRPMAPRARGTEPRLAYGSVDMETIDGVHYPGHIPRYTHAADQHAACLSRSTIEHHESPAARAVLVQRIHGVASEVQEFEYANSRFGTTQGKAKQSMYQTEDNPPPGKCVRRRISPTNDNL